MNARTLSLPNWPPATTEQQLAAERLRQFGAIMVEAPPGSGKTFAGVYLALYVNRLGWTSVHRPALLLTFSRNARVQLEREMDRFQTERWMSASEARAVKVANYHSFYFELISKRAGLWGCSTELRAATVAQKEARVRRAIACTRLRGTDRTSAQEEALRAPSLFLLDQAQLPAELKTLLTNEAKRGLLMGRPHYDDFAPLFLHLLRSSPSLLDWLRAAYPVVILDEFQDTDDLQWQILQLWHPSRLAVFYDRFQMIYGWRGASPDRPEQAAREFDITPEARVEFTEIHRSGAQRDLAQFIRELRQDGLRGGAVVPRPHPWLSLHRAPTPQPDKGLIPDKVRCLSALRWGSVINPDRSTAIITRFSYLADVIRKELSHKPHSRTGPFFRCSLIGGEDSPDEAMRNRIDELRRAETHLDVAGWLGNLLDSLLVDPYRVSGHAVVFRDELARNATEPLRGRRDERLSAMRKEILPWWDELGVGNPAGFRRGLEFVLWASRLLTADLAYADADGTFYVREMIKVAAAATPQDTWESFCDRLENAILVSNHWKHSLRSGVYVLTAHQSKGREFDHVVLPWLSNAGEPIGGWRKPCWMDDEDRRLLYVALTRAKSLVTVVFPSEAPAQILCAWKLLGIPDQSEHPFR